MLRSAIVSVVLLTGLAADATDGTVAGHEKGNGRGVLLAGHEKGNGRGVLLAGHEKGNGRGDPA